MQPRPPRASQPKRHSRGRWPPRCPPGQRLQSVRPRRQQPPPPPRPRQGERAPPEGRLARPLPPRPPLPQRYAPPAPGPPQPPLRQVHPLPGRQPKRAPPSDARGIPKSPPANSKGPEPQGNISSHQEMRECPTRTRGQRPSRWAQHYQTLRRSTPHRLARGVCHLRLAPGRGHAHHARGFLRSPRCGGGGGALLFHLLGEARRKHNNIETR